MIKFVILWLADLVVVTAKMVGRQLTAVMEETRCKGQHCKGAGVQDGADIHVVVVATVAVTVMVPQNQRIKNTMQARLRPR